MIVVRDKTARSLALGRPRGLLQGITALYQIARSRSGFLTSPMAEAGGFIKSSPEVETPDLQLHFSPVAMDDHGRNLKYYFRYGVSAHVCVLASASPLEDPLIDLNLLDAHEDLQLLIKGMRRLRKILGSKVLAALLCDEYLPGNAQQTDAELEGYVRERASHIYHPVGSCKMGQDDMAVVDT